MHLSDSIIGNESSRPLPHDELRVPVRRAEVEVRTERGSRNAVVFLAPCASPADFFDDSREFFPADEGGSIRLYARSAVVTLVVPGDGPTSALVEAGVSPTHRTVTVHLRNGETVCGTLTLLSSRSRTLDVVNAAGRSFEVRTEESVIHVAKAFVESIEEVVK